MTDMRSRPSVDAVVDGYRDRLAGRRIHLRPDIPAKKLRHAIDTYAPGVAPEDVIALLDGTVTGNAKDGALLTATDLYGHEVSGESARAALVDLREVGVEPHPSGAVVSVDGRRIFTAGLVDVDRVELFADLVRAVAHPDRRPASPPSAAVPEQRPVTGVPRDDRQVQLDLLHLVSAEWHRDALERSASGRFVRFPISVRVPEEGTGSETRTCPECGTPCVIKMVSKALRRKAELVGAALLLPSAAYVALMMLTEDSWYPTAATWLKVITGVLFVLSLVAGGIGGWMLWWATDLDSKKGVVVGQVAPQSDYTGGFARHSAVLRGKS